MEIKTENGTYDVTGAGQGLYNSIAGSLGLASFLGIGNSNGMGLLGSGNSQNYVSKEAFELSMQLAAKDSQLALLQSEKSTDAKMLEVYKELASKDNQIRTLIQANKDEQSAINLANVQQDATIAATIAAMQANIAALNGMTKLVIPASSVCDTSCGCGCSNS